MNKLPNEGHMRSKYHNCTDLTDLRFGLDDSSDFLLSCGFRDTDLMDVEFTMTGITTASNTSILDEIIFKSRLESQSKSDLMLDLVNDDSLFDCDFSTNEAILEQLMKDDFLEYSKPKEAGCQTDDFQSKNPNTKKEITDKILKNKHMSNKSVNIQDDQKIKLSFEGQHGKSVFSNNEINENTKKSVTTFDNLINPIEFKIDLGIPKATDFQATLALKAFLQINSKNESNIHNIKNIKNIKNTKTIRYITSKAPWKKHSYRKKYKSKFNIPNGVQNQISSLLDLGKRLEEVEMSIKENEKLNDKLKDELKENSLKLLCLEEKLSSFKIYSSYETSECISEINKSNHSAPCIELSRSGMKINSLKGIPLKKLKKHKSWQNFKQPDIKVHYHLESSNYKKIDQNILKNSILIKRPIRKNRKSFLYKSDLLLKESKLNIITEKPCCKDSPKNPFINELKRDKPVNLKIQGDMLKKPDVPPLSEFRRPSEHNISPKNSKSKLTLNSKPQIIRDEVINNEKPSDIKDKECKETKPKAPKTILILNGPSLPFKNLKVGKEEIFELRETLMGEKNPLKPELVPIISSNKSSDTIVEDKIFMSPSLSKLGIDKKSPTQSKSTSLYSTSSRISGIKSVPSLTKNDEKLESTYLSELDVTKNTKELHENIKKDLHKLIDGINESKLETAKNIIEEISKTFFEDFHKNLSEKSKLSTVSSEKLSDMSKPKIETSSTEISGSDDRNLLSEICNLKKLTIPDLSAISQSIDKKTSKSDSMSNDDTMNLLLKTIKPFQPKLFSNLETIQEIPNTEDYVESLSDVLSEIYKAKKLKEIVDLDTSIPVEPQAITTMHFSQSYKPIDISTKKFEENIQNVESTSGPAPKLVQHTVAGKTIILPDQNSVKKDNLLDHYRNQPPRPLRIGNTREIQNVVNSTSELKQIMPSQQPIFAQSENKLLLESFKNFNPKIPPPPPPPNIVAPVKNQDSNLNLTNEKMPKYLKVLTPTKYRSEKNEVRNEFKENFLEGPKVEDDLRRYLKKEDINQTNFEHKVFQNKQRLFSRLEVIKNLTDRIQKNFNVKIPPEKDNSTSDSSPTKSDPIDNLPEKPKFWKDIKKQENFTPAVYNPNRPKIKSKADMSVQIQPSKTNKGILCETEEPDIVAQEALKDALDKAVKKVQPRVKFDENLQIEPQEIPRSLILSNNPSQRTNEISKSLVVSSNILQRNTETPKSLLLSTNLSERTEAPNSQVLSTNPSERTTEMSKGPVLSNNFSQRTEMPKSQVLSNNLSQRTEMPKSPVLSNNPSQRTAEIISTFYTRSGINRNLDLGKSGLFLKPENPIQPTFNEPSTGLFLSNNTKTDLDPPVTNRDLSFFGDKSPKNLGILRKKSRKSINWADEKIVSSLGLLGLKNPQGNQTDNTTNMFHQKTDSESDSSTPSDDVNIKNNSSKNLLKQLENIKNNSKKSSFNRTCPDLTIKSGILKSDTSSKQESIQSHATVHSKFSRPESTPILNKPQSRNSPIAPEDFPVQDTNKTERNSKIENMALTLHSKKQERSSTDEKSTKSDTYSKADTSDDTVCKKVVEALEDDSSRTKGSLTSLYTSETPITQKSAVSWQSHGPHKSRMTQVVQTVQSPNSLLPVPAPIIKRPPVYVTAPGLQSSKYVEMHLRNKSRLATIKTQTSRREFHKKEFLKDPDMFKEVLSHVRRMRQKYSYMVEEALKQPKQGKKQTMTYTYPVFPTYDRDTFVKDGKTEELDGAYKKRKDIFYKFLKMMMKKVKEIEEMEKRSKPNLPKDLKIEKCKKSNQIKNLDPVAIASSLLTNSDSNLEINGVKIVNNNSEITLSKKSDLSLIKRSIEKSMSKEKSVSKEKSIEKNFVESATLTEKPSFKRLDMGVQTSSISCKNIQTEPQKKKEYTKEDLIAEFRPSIEVLKEQKDNISSLSSNLSINSRSKVSNSRFIIKKPGGTYKLNNPLRSTKLPLKVKRNAVPTVTVLRDKNVCTDFPYEAPVQKISPRSLEAIKKSIERRNKSAKNKVIFDEKPKKSSNTINEKPKESVIFVGDVNGRKEAVKISITTQPLKEDFGTCSKEDLSKLGCINDIVSKIEEEVIHRFKAYTPKKTRNLEKNKNIKKKKLKTKKFKSMGDFKTISGKTSLKSSGECLHCDSETERKILLLLANSKTQKSIHSENIVTVNNLICDISNDEMDENIKSESSSSCQCDKIVEEVNKNESSSSCDRIKEKGIKNKSSSSCKSDKIKETGIKNESSSSCKRDKIKETGIKNESSSSCKRDKIEEKGIRNESSSSCKRDKTKETGIKNESSSLCKRDKIEEKGIKNESSSSCKRDKIKETGIKNESSSLCKRDKIEEKGIKNASSSLCKRDKIEEKGIKNASSSLCKRDKIEEKGIKNESSSSCKSDKIKERVIKNESSSSCKIVEKKNRCCLKLPDSDDEPHITSEIIAIKKKDQAVACNESFNKCPIKIEFHKEVSPIIVASPISSESSTESSVISEKSVRSKYRRVTPKAVKNFLPLVKSPTGTSVALPPAPKPIILVNKGAGLKQIAEPLKEAKLKDVLVNGKQVANKKQLRKAIFNDNDHPNIEIVKKPKKTIESKGVKASTIKPEEKSKWVNTRLEENTKKILKKKRKNIKKTKPLEEAEKKSTGTWTQEPTLDTLEKSLKSVNLTDLIDRLELLQKAEKMLKNRANGKHVWKY